MEVILFIGIPATGKSTFYQTRFAATHLRVSRDMLKTAARTRSLFEWCLARQQPCVLDNTNTTPSVRAYWLRSAREMGIPVTGYFFESKIADALARNRLREGAARIPDAGVIDHHGRLVVPRMDEGFAALYFVRLAEGGFEVESWNHGNHRP